ncbi:ATP-binding protein [Actinomarinicola tropica]|uniref:Anti-sigma B factor RsbW n=1 Tax=Actinomarinicola tropica TaxID=2789776 RepID=A0A5Q2RM10_9ACTN|nr:ATP-binding protein [Actinomarinicola tropica]QGG96514.1 anti-sigma B factor RsbW [Actinomarinicola tropica]
MSEVVELEIPARPDFLSLARLVITGAANVEPTFSDDRIEDLRIAVSEAVTNAIEAHVSSGAEERVVLRCDLAEDRIEVEVIDRGSGFDPENAPTAPAPEDPERLLHESGLGIPLMRELVDETEFRASPTGTVVRLVVTRERRL